MDLLTTNAEDSTLMDITVLLPNGELEIGTTATLEFTKTTTINLINYVHKNKMM